MAREIELWKPSTTLSIEQEVAKSKAILQCATSRLDALKQAKRLIQSWPHANPPDPAGYAQAIAETLAQYPLGLVEECCDPRTGLARTREFPPTVAAVVEWSEKRLTYHRGMVKWGQAKAAERPEFPAEHRQSMLKRLQDLMHDMFKKPVAETAE